MGLRFFNHVNLIPGLRMNLSQSGPSLSVGHRGGWITIGPRGKRVTVGRPGHRPVLNGECPAGRGSSRRAPASLRGAGAGGDPVCRGFNLAAGWAYSDGRADALKVIGMTTRRFPPPWRAEKMPGGYTFGTGNWSTYVVNGAAYALQ